MCLAQGSTKKERLVYVTVTQDAIISGSLTFEQKGAAVSSLL